jgi:hypothetical protein
MQEIWDEQKCIPLLKFTKLVSMVIRCGPYRTSWSSGCVDQVLGG